MNGQFPQIFGQVFRKSCKLPVDKEKLLTNITKNPILDGAGVLQAHLEGAFLVWTLLKGKRNKVLSKNRNETPPLQLGTGVYISYI